MNSIAQQPPPAPPQPPPALGLAIASLVLGALAFLSSFLLIGGLFGVVGLILGIAHLARHSGRNGMAWGGVGLSILGILASVCCGALYYPIVKRAIEAARDAGRNDGGGAMDEWKGVVAPDFSVAAVDGRTIKLGELKGKRVVLDFWATWCPPCRKEIPHFIKLRDETSPDQLVIIGISSEDEATLKSFIKKNDMNYPIASADNLPSPYQEVSAIPTTFFIDRKGVIQSVFVGYHEFDELKQHALANDFEGELKSTPAPSASGIK